MMELSCEKNQRLLVQSRFLTLSVPEILENSIFVRPVIPQTLNVNNLRTTSAKSINLHTIRKLTEYSLKQLQKGSVYCYGFRDITVRRQVGIIPCPAGYIERMVKLFNLLTIFVKKAPWQMFDRVLPSWHLLVQSQQQKNQNIVGNLFKVNNKDTTAKFWCLYC